MPSSAMRCISSVRICTSNWWPAGAHHRGVQRLIAVGARHGDEVLDAAGHGTPESMNEPEDGVAGGYVLRDYADGQQIVDLIEGNFSALQLLKNGVEALDAPLDAWLRCRFRATAR